MKTTMLLILLLAGPAFVMTGCSKDNAPSKPAAPATQAAPVTPVSLSNETVETACASCIYTMEGVAECQPAVKINGKTYLVEGANIDAHEAGLCESAKKAVVTGSTEGDKFIASSYELQDMPTETQ